MPLCRGLGFQVTPSPRSVQCTLTGGNAQWSISSRTVLNFDLFSGTLFLDIGSVRQRNFTPDFEIKVLCDIFLLLSAITWCFSPLLSTRSYAQRFAQFLKPYCSQYHSLQWWQCHSKECQDIGRNAGHIIRIPDQVRPNEFPSLKFYILYSVDI